MLITSELIHALPPGDRRVFNRKEAASYIGVSVGYFNSLVEADLMPPALPMSRVKRWDKEALDVALNKMSGVVPRASDNSPKLAYDAWKASRGQD